MSVAPGFSGRTDGVDGNERRAPQAVDDGVLVGWLVSYDESGKGSAREIRSGKFFVSGSQLRDSDVVVAHHSVSTPHCLAQASGADGLRLLDLMSKRGTFIKRRGTNAFTPFQDLTAVSHGDWIRIGQYEVLVCLVPTSGK